MRKSWSTQTYCSNLNKYLIKFVLFGRGETVWYNSFDRVARKLGITTTSIDRKYQRWKLTHFNWTFLDFTSVSKRLQFASNRLYMCNELTSICIETACIETTLYRNDRTPIIGVGLFVPIHTYRGDLVNKPIIVTADNQLKYRAICCSINQLALDNISGWCRLLNSIFGKSHQRRLPY